MMVKSDENPSPDTPVQPIVPPTPQPPVVPVVPKAAQVVLDSTKLTVRVDEIFNLKASVLPTTAGQQLTWQLSEPGIVDMLAVAVSEPCKRAKSPSPLWRSTAVE